jgi:hypothetical protein
MTVVVMRGKWDNDNYVFNAWEEVPVRKIKVSGMRAESFHQRVITFYRPNEGRD